MASVNKVILVGNVGHTPELKHTASDKPVTNVSLATSDSWKNKDGEKQERVEWHKLIFFDRLAEVVAQYVTKGSQIYVEGKIQTRKWQDKEGNDRYTTEIVCDRMQMIGGRKDTTEDETPAEKPAPKAKAPSKFDDLADDIPF